MGFLEVYAHNYDELKSAFNKLLLENNKPSFILAYTLGNYFNIKKIKVICEKYNLCLIEDCCDAFSSIYDVKKIETLEILLH